MRSALSLDGVWVNGTHVGGHTGGYTPFELECGGAIRRDGPNTVTVRVFDSADVADTPHGKQGGRWYTPVSGPWQPVSLVERPRERIERIRCAPDALQGMVSIAVTARGLDGPRAPARAMPNAVRNSFVEGPLIWGIAVEGDLVVASEMRSGLYVLHLAR